MTFITAIFAGLSLCSPYSFAFDSENFSFKIKSVIQLFELPRHHKWQTQFENELFADAEFAKLVEETSAQRYIDTIAPAMRAKMIEKVKACIESPACTALDLNVYSSYLFYEDQNGTTGKKSVEVLREGLQKRAAALYFKNPTQFIHDVSSDVYEHLNKAELARELTQLSPLAQFEFFYGQLEQRPDDLTLVKKYLNYTAYTAAQEPLAYKEYLQRFFKNYPRGWDVSDDWNESRNGYKSVLAELASTTQGLTEAEKSEIFIHPEKESFTIEVQIEAARAKIEGDKKLRGLAMDALRKLSSEFDEGELSKTADTHTTLSDFLFVVQEAHPFKIGHPTDRLSQEINTLIRFRLERYVESKEGGLGFWFYHKLTKENPNLAAYVKDMFYEREFFPNVMKVETDVPSFVFKAGGHLGDDMAIEYEIFNDFFEKGDPGQVQKIKRELMNARGALLKKHKGVILQYVDATDPLFSRLHLAGSSLDLLPVGTIDEIREILQKDPELRKTTQHVLENASKSERLVHVLDESPNLWTLLGDGDLVSDLGMTEREASVLTETLLSQLMLTSEHFWANEDSRLLANETLIKQYAKLNPKKIQAINALIRRQFEIYREGESKILHKSRLQRSFATFYQWVISQKGGDQWSSELKRFMTLHNLEDGIQHVPHRKLSNCNDALTIPNEWLNAVNWTKFFQAN